MGTMMVIICILIGILCGSLISAGLVLNLMIKSNAFGSVKSKKEEKEQALNPELHYNEIAEGHRILFFQ